MYILKGTTFSQEKPFKYCSQIKPFSGTCKKKKASVLHC